MSAKKNPQQVEFDGRYITTKEIQDRLSVARSQILRARERGMLPDPIIVNAKTHIWKRTKEFSKLIEAWELQLKAARKQLK